MSAEAEEGRDPSGLFVNAAHDWDLLAQLHAQRVAGTFCDVVLHYGAAEHYAHRNVLAASSAYFHSLLGSAERWCAPAHLTIGAAGANAGPATHQSAFTAILDYLYTGRITVDLPSVSDTLHLSNLLGLAPLSDHCASFLEHSLAPTNCFQIRTITETHRLTALVKTIDAYVFANLPSVLESGEMVELDEGRLEMLIGRTAPVTEVQRLRLVCQWVGHRVGERRGRLPPLLADIRWGRVGPMELYAFLRSTALLQDSEWANYQVLQSLKDSCLLPDVYFDRLAELRTKFVTPTPAGDTVMAEEETSRPGEVATTGETLMDRSSEGVDVCGAESFAVVEVEGSAALGNAAATQQGVSDEEENDEGDVHSLASESAAVSVSELHSNSASTDSKAAPSIAAENGKRFDAIEFDGENVVEAKALLKGRLGVQRSGRKRKAACSDEPHILDLSNSSTTGTVKSEALLEDNQLQRKRRRKQNDSQSVGLIDEQSEMIEEVEMAPMKRRNRGALKGDELEGTSQPETKHCISVKGKLPKNASTPAKRTSLKSKQCGRGIRSKKENVDGNYPLSADEIEAGEKPAMEEKKTRTSRNSVQRLRCADCSFHTTSAEKMALHTRAAHASGATFACTLCDFRCAWNRELYAHARTAHFPGPPHRCDLCAHAADTVQQLLRHRMDHTRERPHVCGTCGAAFKRKNNLVAHTRGHTGAKTHVCPVCSRAFATKGTLTQHVVTHDDHRPFLCDQCGFATKYQSHLIAHRRTHTGDVFACQFAGCSYSTPKRSQLACHTRSHLSVRAHVCAHCARAFVERSHLVRHERLHLEAKPFACARCEYASTRRDKLKEHWAKYHDDSPGGEGGVQGGSGKCGGVKKQAKKEGGKRMVSGEGGKSRETKNGKDKLKRRTVSSMIDGNTGQPIGMDHAEQLVAEVVSKAVPSRHSLPNGADDSGKEMTDDSHLNVTHPHSDSATKGRRGVRLCQPATQCAGVPRRASAMPRGAKRGLAGGRAVAGQNRSVSGKQGGGRALNLSKAVSSLQGTSTNNMASNNGEIADYGRSIVLLNVPCVSSNGGDYSRRQRGSTQTAGGNGTLPCAGDETSQGLDLSPVHRQRQQNQQQQQRPSIFSRLLVGVSGGGGAKGNGHSDWATARNDPARPLGDRRLEAGLSRVGLSASVGSGELTDSAIGANDDGVGTEAPAGLWNVGDTHGTVSGSISASGTGLVCLTSVTGLTGQSNGTENGATRSDWNGPGRLGNGIMPANQSGAAAGRENGIGQPGEIVLFADVNRTFVVRMDAGGEDEDDDELMRSIVSETQRT